MNYKFADTKANNYFSHNFLCQVSLPINTVITTNNNNLRATYKNINRKIVWRFTPFLKMIS